MSDSATVSTIRVATGVRLAYRAAGDPAAPAVILLHALGEDGSTWDTVTAALAPEWRCLAPDLRGHGRSDWPGTYSLELMRDDVLAFAAASGLDRPAGFTLVGHSMGAAVAYLVAEARPGLVRRMVLEDPLPPVRPAAPRPVPDRPAGPPAVDWDAVLALYRQRNDPDPAWWDGLTGITAPTLIVGGGGRSHMPQDKLAEMAGLIPDGKMITIDSGHEVHAGRPDEFIAGTRAFLAGGGTR